ncbi:hypothetical protein BHE74_00015795 [Ensete ventricosum]|nr:hypothetical protein BHE74_00015795 [Ensete ventricosum]
MRTARYRAVPPKIDRRQSIEGRNRLSTVFETVQQAHDVPFGSTFEVHTETKLFSMQQNMCLKDKYKKEVAQMLEIARSYLVKAKGSSQDKPEASETPTSTLS